MAMKFLGTDHPSMAVKDPAAMSAWCCGMLGYRKHAGESNGPYLLEAPDGSFLEVMPQDQSPRPTRGNFTSGWSHVALRVANLDEAIAEMTAKGVRWTGEIANAVGGGRLRNFADPDGNAWQIVERAR